MGKHTPTYKSSRILRKSQDRLTKVRRAAASGAQAWWRWERDEGGRLGAGKFPLCDLRGHHTGFHFGILGDTEYLCCLHFSVCLLCYPAINAKETIILLQSPQKPWDSLRLLHNMKLWGKKEEKNAFQGERGKFSGNSAAAEDISNADKEFDMNSEENSCVLQPKNGSRSHLMSCQSCGMQTIGQIFIPMISHH